MNTRLVALGIIALILVLLFGSLFGGFIVSGYGGIASKVHSVEHQYSPRYVDVVIGEQVATIHPNSFGPIGATGLRLELGTPMYTGDDVWYTETIIEKDVYEDGDELEREWAVHIAYFDLSFTVRTDKGAGALAITDVTFWIELQENQFDVFTAPDAVEAFILQVTTIEPIATNDVGLVDVTPGSSGFSFDLTPMDSEPIPDWMSDSGYQGLLSELKHVRFSVHVNSMAPQLLGPTQATWTCEVNALVFGYWEKYSPYYGWEPPPVFNLFGFLDDIFAGLSLIIGLAVGIILSIAIIKFIPDKRIATIILVCAWAVIVLMFGFLELLA